MQRALLERSQFIVMMADATRGGRAMHLLSRRSGGMHAEAAVQAREMHLMHGHGWPHARPHQGPTWHRTWTLTMSQHGQPVSTHG